jgi:hypothetical protein
LTLLAYPDDGSSRIYRTTPEQAVTFSSRRTASETVIELDPQSESYVLRIKEYQAPTGLQLSRGAAVTPIQMTTTYAEFDAASDAAFYDAEGHYLWVRFDTHDSGARLAYTTTPSPTN